MRLAKRSVRAGSRSLAGMLVVALVAGLMAAPAVADSGMPVVDDVVSQGAELMVQLRVDDPAPVSGDQVEVSVTLHNRAAAAAAAEWPSAGISGDRGGIRFDAVDETSLPEGWAVWLDAEGGSASLNSGGGLAPGDTVSFTVHATVIAANGSSVEVSAWAWAHNRWDESPRPGSWAQRRLEVGGSALSGRVLARQSGAPLADVCVEVNDHDAGFWSSTTTWVDGSWQLAIPASASVQVRYQPSCQVAYGMLGTVTGYAAQWHPGVSTPRDAVPVTSADDRALGDVWLDGGGGIAGTVTNVGGVEGLQVWVNAEEAGSGWWVAGTTAVEGGRYVMHGLPAGEYVVGFQAQEDSGLALQFYDGAGSRTAARSVVVTAGHMIDGIDATLVAAARIRGTVTGSVSGAALEGIDVSVQDLDGGWVQGATTDVDGRYEVGGLAPGSYLIRFRDPDGGYVPVFHDGSWRQDAASPLVVGVGQDQVLDMALERGVSVTGVVTSAAGGHGIAAGQPIADVTVVAWLGGLDFGTEPVGFGVTDESGRYTLHGLPAGQIALAFVHGLNLGGDDSALESDWAVSFWPGVSDPRTAGTLDLAGAQPVTDGIDATLSPAPVLSGRVLDAHGGSQAEATGLSGLAVALVTPFGGDPMSITWTEDDGSFELTSPFVDVDVYVGAVDIENRYAGTYPPLWFGGAVVDLADEALDPAADGAQPVPARAGATHTELYLVHDPPPAPGLPADAEAAAGHGTVTVAWGPAAGVVDAYLVMLDGEVVAAISASDGFRSSVGPNAGPGAHPYRHVLTGLRNGQSYRVSVTARNLGGTSPPVTFNITPSSTSSNGGGAEGPAHGVPDVAPRANRPPSCAGLPRPDFLDVTAAATHSDSIGCAAAIGLLQGRADGTFAGDRPVSRGQIASILQRALEASGVNLPDDFAGFNDVTGSTHEQAINRLAAAGILHGVGQRNFDPHGNVTRGQLMTILDRTASLYFVAYPDASQLWFNDAIGSTHAHAISRLAEAGIARGLAPDGTRFAPSRPVRRDQAAAFVIRWLEDQSSRWPAA